jgi:hypothetical protein
MPQIIRPVGNQNTSGVLYAPSGDILIDLNDDEKKQDRRKLRSVGKISARFMGHLATAAVCGLVLGAVAAGVGWRMLEDKAESSQIGQDFVSDLQSAAEDKDLEEWFYGLVANSGITLERVAEVMAENQHSVASELAQGTNQETETTIVNEAMIATFAERIEDPRYRQYFAETIQNPDTEPEEIADLMFGPIDTTTDEAG